jgi:hypothetical protein
LVNACTKGRNIRECEYHPQNLAIGSGVGGYPKKKTSIAIAGFAPTWCSVSHHLRAQLIEILHASKSLAKTTTDGRGRQAKHRCGGAVDTGNFAIAVGHNYRKIDCIKQVDLVDGDPTQSRSLI